MLETIWTCTTTTWSPGIGDPTVLGWATVAVYFITAALAFRVVRHAPFPQTTRGPERRFWVILVVVLCLLGVNKELDLQSALTAVGRCLAQAQGWYDTRRMVQFGFIVTLGSLAVLLALWLLWRLRGTWARSGVPIMGLCMVLGFVMMRAVGFHNFDRMIGVEVMNLRLNGWLELSGPILISVWAIWITRHSRRKSRQ